MADQDAAVKAYNEEHAYTKPATGDNDVMPKKVVVLGDSYSAGAQSWVEQVGASEGWIITNLAAGGTGYATSVTTNAEKACGKDYCPSYLEQVDAAVTAAPSLILITGGRNDLHVDPVVVEEKATQLLAALKSKLPDAEVVVVNAQWDARDQPIELTDIAAAITRAAEATGAAQIDIGQPLSGQPQLIQDDNVHPNEAGQAALADALLNARPWS